MARTTAKENQLLPAIMKITASAGKAARFIPYRENFVTTVPAGHTLYLTAKTFGQFLYYKEQGFTKVDAVGNENDKIVIPVPALITIRNNASKVMHFVPYRENFQAKLEPVKVVDGVVVEGEYVFEADTAGQVLYYIAQDSTGNGEDGTGIDVAFREKSSATAE